MRGGKLFVKGDAGFRVGIHMKGYMDKAPVMIIGGTAGNFFGEYMAGGVLILLGINRKKDTPIAGDYLGTGMHGGVMYIRGEVDTYQCGAEVGVSELNDEDKKKLSALIKEYCNDLGFNYNEIMSEKFVKLYPKSSRPYGKLYAY
jgi:glutamate synthase domain-containing protein 3